MKIYLTGLVITGIILFASLGFPISARAAPAISQIVTNASSYQNNQIPKFEKFEITFQVPNSVASNTFYPFDPAPPSGVAANTGISVNAVFTDPQGNTFNQPAFYYQEFQDLVKGNKEWFYPASNYVWKVRFTPHTIGTWQYRLVAQDASGTIQSAIQPFTVTTSASHGFIKVSPTDPRYFEYDDGTYFPALGFNLNGGELDNVNPVIGNTPEFQSMGQNGIELSRVWITQFSIYGEAYGKWTSPNRVHQTQEPRMGIVNPINSLFATNYPNLIPPQPPVGSEYYMWLEFNETVSPDGTQQRFTPCRFLSQLPVKQNTNYRVKVRYRDVGVEGPKVVGSPFGFAVKNAPTSLSNATSLCNEPTAGTVVAATYNASAVSADPQNPGWSILSGTFNSGATDFLNQFYITFNNVKSQDSDAFAGHVFVDQVWLEEAACTANCPNLIPKPNMSMHQYINQRDAYSFDKVLDLAKQNNLYLKAVMLEKNDRIFQSIDFNGQPVANPSINNFYGNRLVVTKVRWLQQAWWRYMQARWGYSPNIHSWELLNEGHSGNSEGHWDMADEFGKYMKCRVFGQEPVTDATLGRVCRFDHPDAHLTSTSFFGGAFPWQFWNNGGSANAYKLYRDMDYADQHLYAHQSGQEHTPGFFDSALFTYELSSLPNTFTSATRKPFIRGEVAWEFEDGNNLLEVNADGGVWLHDFIWGGINQGGLMEHFFTGAHFTKQVYSLNSNPAYDHRPMFKPYYDFIKNIPLNNGRYVDAGASASLSTQRAWGQKDPGNNRTHLWISNTRHIWCSVIGTVAGCPQPAWSSLTAAQKRLSGTVTVGGFSPNTSLTVSWWPFTTTVQLLPVITTSVTTNGQGVLTLTLDALDPAIVDVGVKIGNYSQTSVLPGDLDQDGDVDFLDYQSFTPHLGTTYSNADINNSGRVEIFDFNQLIQNFGKQN